MLLTPLNDNQSKLAASAGDHGKTKADIQPPVRGDNTTHAIPPSALDMLTAAPKTNDCQHPVDETHPGPKPPDTLSPLPSKRDVKRMAQIMKDLNPRLWELCCPRRYIGANGYRDPSLEFGKHLMGMLRFAKVVSEDRYPQPGLVKLVQDSVPTYFVSERLAEAAAQTSPPDDFSLNCLSWPLPSAVLALPMDWARKHFGRNLAFIAFSHVPSGAYPDDAMRAKGLNVPRVNLLKAGVLVCPVVPTGFGFECGFYFLDPTVGIGDLRRVRQVEQHETLVRHERADAVSLREPVLVKSSPSQVIDFLVSLLGIISAKPEFLKRTVNTCQRPARNNGGSRPKDALWVPNILGQNYESSTNSAIAPGNSCSAAKRQHWRRGHFRFQCHGPRQAIVFISQLPKMAMSEAVDWSKVDATTMAAFQKSHRLIWSEPVIINPGSGF
jgi:hypothetical protein